MLRNRLLILLSGCLLATSAAWADNVGYIDCSGHPDETQVFAKARQTHEVVASLPCGERFTILQYGFIFSRIQTRDGKVGYVYSNVISVDRSGASVPPPTSTRLPAAAPSVPATTATAAQPSPTPAVQPQAAPPAQSAPTQVPATTSNTPSTPVVDVQAKPATPAQTQPTPAQPAPATTSSAPETPAIQPTPMAPTQPQAAPAQAAATEAAASTARVPEVTAAAQPVPTPATQPDATPAAQPEPTPAEAAAPVIRAASATESWEKPNAGIRTRGPRRMPLIELFGGYAFARLDGGGGTSSNLNGALGSFGWNVTPWLQIVADTSYDFVTVSGTKTVLYGNHYGPRLFFGRVRNRWGITPFVEGLVGGSRADVTVSGTGGYATSVTVSYTHLTLPTICSV